MNQRFWFYLFLLFAGWRFMILLTVTIYSPQLGIKTTLNGRHCRVFLVRWEGYDESEDEWKNEYDMTNDKTRSFLYIHGGV